jgi:DNA invertase Pin-like site-specific DNA recombinase
MSRKIGYARVSTKEQHLSRQIAALKDAGIAEENMYIDKQSGKDFMRPNYQKMISELQEGDILYALSIDRLGRNYDEIIEQWRHITKDIKADIIILDMPLLDTTSRNNDLTGKFVADLVLQILSYVAQKEREAIKARQIYGIQKAKAEGVYKKKEIDRDALLSYKRDVDSNRITVKAAAEMLGITRKTWYRLVKDLELAV